MQNSESRDREPLGIVRRAQLAAQVLAVIQADWNRPTPDEVEAVLEMARVGNRDSVILKAEAVVPERP